MAITKTLSLGFSLFFRPTTKHLLHPTVLSHAPKLSLSHQSFYFRCLAPPYKTPKNPFIICHGKLDSDVPEEINEVFFDDNYDMMIDEEEISDEDETESSIDLLIRFLQSMFKKLSKRAKKASRSMLPAVISPQLAADEVKYCLNKIPQIGGWEVSFAVDGILLLAALSIVKALLEVVCTLGSTVFVVILLLRVVWTAVSYFQSSENTSSKGGSSFGTTQPVA
ncbi:protein SHORT HYPOCOTYL IN WHITE LIGHT 1-like [Populus alba x Populus x berolinensis]|nr:protein SHORT HYPOCOTYL IN WHITE LIGHT 1-like [Populus alba x Populus x berolinensis]